MLNGKNREYVKEQVLLAYRDKYPKWTDTRVTEIVENVHLGTMVSVKSVEYPDGEICIYRKSGVIIFDTTPELVRYLEMKASKIISLRDKITIFIVIVTLVLFTVIVVDHRNPEAISLVISSMAGLLGMYTGLKFRGDRKEE